ncbi:MAG: hypothetical protein K6G15_11165 [Desulfovibrio sp.]|nr:hypothetical protein [Desulfovibrio sp.]
MYELLTDPFYEIIKQYDRCVIEYCLMKDDAPYRKMLSHREAVLFAMLRLVDQSLEDKRAAEIRWGKAVADDLCPWAYDMDKAKATPIDTAAFLHAPEIRRIDRNGCRFYDCGRNSYPDEAGRIPYWYAFLEPPHGTRYTPDDFRKVNAALFPKGSEALAAYEWTTDWSDYFDDGHEWWGAACWSVYDGRLNRYAVLFASATD